MPRRKPRIRRHADGWHVIRPGYGFTAAVDAGPYPSHRAALESLMPKLASAGTDFHTTYTPTASDYRRNGHLHWPLEIR